MDAQGPKPLGFGLFPFLTMLKIVAICHLPSAICHLPSAIYSPH
jgi:hypothetical protein